MSSVFTRISRVSNHPVNVIVIDMKIQESDLLVSHRSNDFCVADTETSFLEFCVTQVYCRLALYLCGIKRENMLQRFFISVFDADRKCLHSKVDTPKIFEDSEYENDLLIGFVTHSESMKYPISITCYLETQNAEKSTTNPSDVELQCLRKLSADLQKILDQSSGTDITLHVDGVDIKAHKLILCARSPFFNRLLNQPTIETTLNVFRIEDVRAPIMEELVSFLYTGTKKDHHDFDDACDLYHAAGKFEVMILRDACKIELLVQLQVDNACQMLVLAHDCHDVAFKDEVARFIKANFKTIVNSDSIRKAIKDNVDVALLLMQLQVNAD